MLRHRVAFNWKKYGKLTIVILLSAFIRMVSEVSLEWAPDALHLRICLERQCSLRVPGSQNASRLGDRPQKTALHIRRGRAKSPPRLLEQHQDRCTSK